MMPQSGDLRFHISIAKATRNENASKEMSVNYEVWRDVWADVTPINPKEVLRARQMDQVITHRIHTRYFKGLTYDHCIIFRGRTLNIDNILNIEELNRWYELLCIEVSR